MSREEVQLAGCVGKHPYPNPTLAWRVARKYGCAAYRCAFCGRWHVGGRADGDGPHWIKADGKRRR
ncbi:hypothetical protein [Azospirillum sp. sgz301742]